VNLTVAGWLPPAGYTIVVEKASAYTAVALAPQLRLAVYVAHASLVLAKQTTLDFSAYPPLAKFNLSWNLPVAYALPGDMVCAVNAQGGVDYWFYTSCQCQVIHSQEEWGKRIRYINAFQKQEISR
jgi:hypothetical protein